MNILNKLSIKNLKLNKKRTISTIFGIILSAALICGTFTLATTFQKTLVQNAINESGYYHVKISDISENNLKEIENNRDIKEIYTITRPGYAILENSQNEYKPYIKLYSMNRNIFENLKFNLVEGRAAANSNEIVISNHIISNAKVNYKVGDKIKLEIGKRVTMNNEKLHSSNPYLPDEEQLIDKQEHEFTIVGIIQRPDYAFEGYSEAGYTAITTNLNIGEKDIYLSLKSPKNYETDIPELLGAKDYKTVKSNTEKLKYENYTINRELLRWEVFDFSDSTIAMLYSVVSVVVFIIVFTSVFCIRNSFAISTTEKIKMYGMLASVGATKKQIKKSVIFEALLLGLIGIPLGILSGIFAIFVLIKIVNMLIGEYLLGHIDGIILNVSILPILISIILGFITIYLSAISSARKASKVSPIEQLRSSNDIKMKSNKLKTPKIISKVFKIGGELAYKNLKRSKKKYRTTVISLAVSIFIFITMNSFIVNSFDFTSDYYKDYEYNFYVSRTNEDLENENQILELNNIEEHFILYEAKNDIEIKDESKINKTPQEKEIEESSKNTDYNYNNDLRFLKIIGLDSETFKKYVKKIGEDYKKVKGTGILCDNIPYYDSVSQKTKKIRRYSYEKNDTISGVFGKDQINVKIGAITDINPYGYEKSICDGGYLIVDANEYNNMDLKIDKILINSKKTDVLEDDIKKINKNVYIRNLEAEVKEEKAMVLVIKIFLYGFIAVITLIGVTNIFNTITSNMELRQKEFAMLKSIGMTKKEFNRMINLETIFYGTKSLIYGIILGLLGTFAMYKGFSVKMDDSMYIPINPIILSTIFVFILVFIIMKYSISKINKQNTIETIRKENI